MKNRLAILTPMLIQLSIVAWTEIASAQISESFSDSRDNKTYKTIQIGDQVWMAENLRFSTKNNEPYYGGKAFPGKYGALYKWQTALKVCPEGWHLPNKNEWYELINNFGDIYTDKFLTSSWKEYRKIPKEVRKERKKVAKEAFTKLVEGGSSGFDTRFGGYLDPEEGVTGRAYQVGSHGYFWTADKADDKTFFGKAWGFQFIKSGNSFGPLVKAKRYALSVRCVKDTVIAESDPEILE